jgi:two-component system chemotaxis response regulator CheY
MGLFNRTKKLTLENGDVYEGEIKGGKPHGKGKYTFVNGNVYEGNFILGKPHGKWKYTYVEGNVYKEDFNKLRIYGKEITTMIIADSGTMTNTEISISLAIGYACNFIEAEDSERALALLEIQPVDLILLDWDISGIDFLKKVRPMEKYKILPIIMVISEAAKFNIIEAIKNGATDYITKPINVDRFKEKITRLPQIGPSITRYLARSSPSSS